MTFHELELHKGYSDWSIGQDGLYSAANMPASKGSRFTLELFTPGITTCNVIPDIVYLNRLYLHI